MEKRKRGRPSIGGVKTCTYSCTPAQEKRIRALAKKAGKNKSQHILSAVLGDK